MAGKVTVPIIDISSLIRDDNDSAIMETATLIGKACKEIGFFIIVGHNVDRSIIDAAWEATQRFFELDLDEKLQYVKPQEVYPFGYTPLGGETLSAGKDTELKLQNNSSSARSAPPDLKGITLMLFTLDLYSSSLFSLAIATTNLSYQHNMNRDVLHGSKQSTGRLPPKNTSQDPPWL